MNAPLPSQARASGQLQHVQRVQAADAAHAQSVTNQVFKVWGLIDIEGTGEALFDVTFPVHFVEFPSFGRGWSLMEGEVITTGSYPTCDLGVHSLTHDDDDQTQLRYYTGAKLIIIPTGLETQHLVGHYSFEGRAIVPPVSTVMLAEDTV